MNNITIKDNLEIIDIDKKKICKKRLKKDNTSIFNYLKSKDFHNYIEIKIIDNYVVRDFIDEVDITKEDKLTNLIYIISLLHVKTTHYVNYNLNDIKLFYEKTTDELLNIKGYYNDIVSQYDVYLFNKPSIDLLIKNISLILISIDNSKYFLDKWYEIIKDKQRKRVVMNHNNLKLSNFIVGTSNYYLINFDNYLFDYPIYDIVSLFKNNYKVIDMIDIFNLYSSKYNLIQEEKYLLYTELLKIKKIEFIDNEIINTRNISNLLNYLNKISDFLKNSMKNNK